MNVKFFTAGPRGKKQSQPVKFSNLHDLDSKECKRLLEKFVPVPIRSTKISQQLFLKYVYSHVFVCVMCMCVCVCACVRVCWE